MAAYPTPPATAGTVNMSSGIQLVLLTKDPPSSSYAFIRCSPVIFAESQYMYPVDSGSI